MKDYKRFDRIVFKQIVFKQTDINWFPKPGTKGVINKVNKDDYEIGLDTGNYIYIYKEKANDYFMLDSKLLKALS